ncbi:5-carboxymethyl-2-hydroxymuconate isomerase [Vibrio sp. L3-7]|uniref:5-carboxymethyl-2-hydroxymuconate Delta-isomerase n=1 Tax=Vibrio sp. L3-7 TaxID=2912253 RepID=UPI00118F7FC4|nr:5-carboxymethyl-2-hydroxymuconate isomerase [Vibrio sp. L3-7]MCF7506007.1 5-carboxymethyl-2-hydroxymuconate isomerase [Vibrio sp. L3-7]TVU70934.1 5-carboxymethyl-2-hydroxymuconate isomerase [Vibrio tasmaniensis]
MPHCIIEHSSTIDGQQLNQKVFLGAMESQLFSPIGEDIKVRSLAYQHYQTGELKEDFVHVSVRILSGRNESDKAMLSKSILEQLLSLTLSNASLTVEIIDIDRASYSKVLV